MSHFSDLLNDAADAERHKLSSVLLKAKVFASRVNGRKLKQWIDFELMGYKDGTSVPTYRVIHPIHFGDFAGPFHAAVKNVPLSTDGFEPDLREAFDSTPITDNVGTLEGFLESESEHYHLFLPPLLVELFRRKSTRINGYILNHVQSIIGRPAIHSVLSAIRTRLVDLLIEVAKKYPELEATDDAVKGMSGFEVDKIAETILFQISGDTIVGDKYSARQAGAMGPGATAHHMTFQQLWTNANCDLAAAAEELSRLRAAMRSRASEIGQDEAVAEVARAEAAARKRDGATMMEQLSRVGQWGLKVATDIGASIAADLIVKAMTGTQ
jgi:hypothetical protein